LADELARCRRAARLALALRPAGYDGEVVYLVTLLQCLGRLLVRYHFADEAAQMDRLVLPQPPVREGESEVPGLSEAAAAQAVLGADPDTLGLAAARQWGLDDSVLHLIRREALDAPVHAAATEDAVLRSVASCAIEVVDALHKPAARVRSALQRVVSRYARALELDMRELQLAVQASSGEAAAGPISSTRPAPLTDAVPPGPQPAAAGRQAGSASGRQP
jgi:non-specific serine/threonine protein kinase